MSEAIEDGLFLNTIQRLDKAAQYADIDMRTAAYVHALNRIGVAIASQGTRGLFAEQLR